MIFTDNKNILSVMDDFLLPTSEGGVEFQMEELRGDESDLSSDIPLDMDKSADDSFDELSEVYDGDKCIPVMTDINANHVTESDDLLSSLLPIYTSLPGNREVAIREMVDEEISETFLLIQEAGRKGHGFGEEEWSSEEEFRQDIAGSRCFVVVDACNGRSVAFIILAISKFYRGSDVADPYILVKEEERSKGIGDFCLTWSVRLAKLVGFMAMYVDTFSNNYAMLTIIRRSPYGFSEVGCLPLGGRLSCGTMAQTIIFYLNLDKVELDRTILGPKRPLAAT